MFQVSALKEVTRLHVHKKLLCRGKDHLKFMVDNTGQNGPNCLQQGRLMLDYSKNFLTVGGIKHWNRWLGKVKTSLFIKPDQTKILKELCPCTYPTLDSRERLGILKAEAPYLGIQSWCTAAEIGCLILDFVIQERQ